VVALDLNSFHSGHGSVCPDAVNRLHLDRLEPMGDTGAALRFVRFIDRVVALVFAD